MSGILAGKAPQTDAQWARDVQQQLDGLANPKTQRIGNWVLSTASDGTLQATAPGQSAVTLGGAALPVTGAGATPITSQFPAWLQSFDELVADLTGTDGGSLADLTNWWTTLSTDLFGGSIATSWTTILAEIIPGLDASKITTGSLSLSSITTAVTTWWNDILADLSLSGVTDTGTFSTWLSGIESGISSAVTTGDWDTLLTSLFGGTTVLSALQSLVIPGLDASKITTGTFAQSFVTGLAGDLAALLPTTTYQSLLDNIANAMGHSGTGFTLTNIESYLGLIPGSNIASILSTSVIPSLDASKITTGTFAQSFVTGLAGDLAALLPTTTYQSLLDNIANAMGHSGTGFTLANVETYLGFIPGTNIASTLSTGVIPSLDASKITTGTFAQSFVSGLTSDLAALLPTTTYQSLLDKISNALGVTGTGHTLTQVEGYLGLIPGANIASILSTGVIPLLNPSQIPSLDASKITTGTFAQSFVTGLTSALAALLPSTTYQSLLDNIANAMGHGGTGYTLANIESYLGLIPGTNIASAVTATVIPSLDASKITTGTFAQSFITGLTSLWSGIFGTSTPTGSSVLVTGAIPALPASQITSGTFGSGLIPSLDASKITTGTFAQSFVTGLTSALSALLPTTTYQSLLDNIANAMGHSGTGFTLANIESYLGLIPGSNIASAVTATVIPSLDASKITTGTFAQSFVTGLSTSLAALLPSTTYQSLLDNIANAMGVSGTGHTLSQIESYLGLIPGANIASTISATVIPSLDASKITTGAFAQSFVTGLTSALSALLPSTTYQSLLDNIANAMGHSGTGYTLANIESYLGLIPGTNIASAISATVIPSLDASKITTGTFAQSFVTGLSTSLAALLPNTTYQSLLDNIANAMGHSGTGFTLANVESYLGLIPGANIASAVSATVVPALDASKITTGSFAQSIISGLTSLWTGIFGTSTPTGSSVLVTSAIPALPASQITTGTLLSALIPGLDASKIVSGALTGATVPGGQITGAASVATSLIENGLGGTDLGADIQALATNLWGAVTQGPTSGALQNIADAMHQITYGGGATGTGLDVTSLKQMLAAQPAATVVPAPNPSSTGSPIHGSSGTGWTPTTSSTGLTTMSTSGSHTIAAGDNYVVTRALYITRTGPYPATSAAYGTQPMSSITGRQALASVTVSGVNYVLYLETFGLFGPASGAQTPIVTVTPGTGSLVYCVAACSDSYSGVQSVSSLGPVANTAGNPSQSVSSAAIDVVVQHFALLDSVSLTASGYTQTSRANSGAINTGAGVFAVLVAGDAPGAGTVSFAATSSTTASPQEWAGVAINLVGAGATPLGSGFRQHRVSTGTTAAGTGSFLFPNSFFDTNDQITPDYTSAPATNNKITVANAGWYIVTINCSLGGSSGSNNGLAVSPLLYHNGSIAQWGNPSMYFDYSLTGDFGSNAMGASFIVYCNAGDTLQPGYNTSVANSLTITGEATGAKTYWSVALLNRSLL